MFWELYKFEFNYRFKMISTYIFMLVFLSLGFLLVNVLGGAISGARIAIIGDGERLLLNSATINTLLLSNFSLILIFIIAAVVAMSFNRDFESNTYLLFFSKPITKSAYVLSKLFFVVTFLIILKLLMIAGQYIAYYLPWIEKTYFMEPELAHYLSPLFTLLIPNILILCSILTAVMIISKKSYPVYIASLIILVGYYFSLSLLSDLNNRYLAALVDPMGLSAAFEYTKHWTIAERNIQIIYPTGVILHNRLIWMGFGFSFLLISMKIFRLGWFSKSSRERKKRENKVLLDKPVVETVIMKNDFQTVLYQLFRMIKYNLRLVFHSFSFYLILASCLALAIFNIAEAGRVYGVLTYPVTYQVAEGMISVSRLFFIIILIILAGEMAWESRSHRYHLILDSLPVKKWVLYTSQLLSLNFIATLMMTILIIAGVIYQFINGYSNFEIPVYLKVIFGINYLSIFLYIILALFIQSIMRSKYLAHFIIIIFLFGQTFLRQLGINHNLMLFGRTPAVIYSDMNSLGAGLTGYIYTGLYWFLFGLLIIQLTILLYPQGLDFNPGKIIQGLRKREAYPILLNLILFLVSGGYVFYNTNILNEYFSPKRMEIAMAHYELTYKDLERAIQPSITDIYLEVDIYPVQRDFNYRGTYTLKNFCEEEIKELYLSIPTEIRVNNLQFSRNLELKKFEPDSNFRIYSFHEPLHHGEEFRISFDCDMITRGFSHNENDFLNHNGTFIHNHYFPQIGYNNRNELSSNRIRKRYGLSPTERMPEIDDDHYLNFNYVSNNDHWIGFESKVSTASDQIALAPGDLIDSYIKDDRAFFHYKLPGKMINYYAFLSAAYSVRKDQWNDVDIEVYYHPTHQYNLDTMIRGVKESLSYYSSNFSPYPYQIIRIAEFPRYGAFAQSLPTLIPFSESVGFIANIQKEKINYPYFITAHEMAHQWWAHQVISANVKGALLVTEALSQYSALMVKKNNLGNDMVQKQLRYERDNYFSSRSSEQREENPLYLDEGQPYIHYHKGALALYGLSNYIGEEKINNILRSFLKNYAYSYMPYPTSLDLLRYFYNEIPDSLHNLLDDTFRKITVYNNKITEASKEENVDGSYTVYLETESKKQYYDGLGYSSEAELNEWVEIVVYSEIFVSGDIRSVPIYKEFHRIIDEKNSFVINVDRIPTRVGIDPDNYLLESYTENKIKDL